MILTDQAILGAIEQGTIKIQPFEQDCLGSNSYDVHLSPHLLYCDIGMPEHLDAKQDPAAHFIPVTIPDEGFVLKPGKFYLGSTIEYTESPLWVPFLEGKSSVGRLGISVHLTAGKGDIGFKGHWTLEITAAVPVRVYAGMPFAQLFFHSITGDVLRPYDQKESAKYSGQGAHPVPSKMFLNF